MFVSIPDGGFLPSTGHRRLNWETRFVPSHFVLPCDQDVRSLGLNPATVRRSDWQRSRFSLLQTYPLCRSRQQEELIIEKKNGTEDGKRRLWKKHYCQQSLRTPNPSFGTHGSLSAESQVDEAKVEGDAPGWGAQVVNLECPWTSFERGGWGSKCRSGPAVASWIRREPPAVRWALSSLRPFFPNA